MFRKEDALHQLAEYVRHDQVGLLDAGGRIRHHGQRQVGLRGQQATAAGFDGIEGPAPPDAVDGRRWRAALDDAGLAFIAETPGGSFSLKAAAGIKNVSLELGGKSANVVFADADLESCVESKEHEL